MIRLFLSLLIASAFLFFSSSAKADTERCWVKHPNEPASCAGQFKTIQDAQQDAISSLGCDALNANSTQYQDSKGGLHQTAYYWCYPSGTQYKYYWLWDLPKGEDPKCGYLHGVALAGGMYDLGPARDVAPNGVVLTKSVTGYKVPNNWPDSKAQSCIQHCTVVFTLSSLPTSGGTGSSLTCSEPVINGVRRMYCRGSYTVVGQTPKDNGIYCAGAGGSGTGTDSGQPANPEQNENPPKSCDPVKQDKITLNGKDICVDRTTGKEVNPTTGESADGESNKDKDLKKDKTPDGKDRTTETERTKNPDGSVTEKKTETICDAAGNCKTSTTEKTIGKGDSETNKDPKDKEQEDLCKKYPNKKLCEEKSKYNDSGCPGIPACDGDAVQCGIAIEMKRRNCKDEQELRDAKSQLENSPEVARYNADKAGNSSAQGAAWGAGGSGSGSNSTSININDKFNPDSFQAGACALRDITINLGSAPGGGGTGTLVIPVSEWCAWMPVISACTLIAAAIASLLIIYNGVTRTA